MENQKPDIIEKNGQKESSSGSKRKRKMKMSKKKLIVIIAVILIAVIVMSQLLPFGKVKAPSEITYTESLVERRTVQTTLSSSGTLQPADSYTVTASVDGDILECFFEEGDTVNKDDTLYIVDSSDMENTIDRAQISYDKTLRSYNKIVESLEDLNVYCDYNGIITNVYVEEGDEIQNGAKIADFRDSDTMHLTVPFSYADTSALYKGQAGTVIIDGSFEMRDCVIDEIDSFESNLDGRAVRYVKVKVDNQAGGIFNTTQATVAFGDVSCLELGTFKYNKEGTITSKVSGCVTNIIDKGSRVKADETLVCALESETLEDNYTDAKATLDDAELSFNNTKEKLDDYTIKAPITGTVIEKYSKAGDTLDATRGQTSMAIIYDLSYLKFDMALDELDISQVEVGQKVMISCDALDLTGIEGEISKVSVVGTTSYNSTTYPVTVKIYSPPEGLLAGMNVDAELVIAEAENVLTVPSAAIQRGNIVYVKDNGTKAENDRAPEGYMSVRVETGISNENYIEIKSGELKEGDTVCVPQTVRTMASDIYEMFSMGGMGTMPNGSMPSGGGMPGSGSRPSGMGGGMR